MISLRRQNHLEWPGTPKRVRNKYPRNRPKIIQNIVGEVISQFMEALLWLHSNPPKKKIENCLQDVIKDGYFIFPGLPLFYLSWGILTDPRKKRNIQSFNK
jgi:hypothetical protein